MCNIFLQLLGKFFGRDCGPVFSKDCKENGRILLGDSLVKSPVEDCDSLGIA